MGAIALSAGAAAPEPMPAIDDRWRHYRSPNFELYSHGNEQDSRALLHDLELVRAVFMERFKFVERARVDVTVYLFRTTEEFGAYGAASWGKDHNFRGFYLAGLDRAVISVAPSDNAESARATIFHEYVHHLFRAAEQDPPVWFNEGMAEILGAVKVVGDRLEIGRPHLGRLVTLQQDKLLPLETLFGVNHGSAIYRSSDHTGLFYAQSWALLHYWFFGQSGLPADAVTRFMKVAADRKSAASVDLRAYFQECFGIDYPEMVRRLDLYVSGGSYQFGRQPAPKIPAPSSYVARAAPRDEIRLRLAELALRVNRSSMARFLLVDAAAKTGAEPRLFEVLGAVALAEREESTARERWEDAVAAGTTNPAVFRELGLLESREWFHGFDQHFRLPADVAARLRPRLLRAIEHEPKQSKAYEMLAWVEAYSSEPVVTNVNLIQRNFEAVQQKGRTLVALALVRVHLGQADEAKSMLGGLQHLEWDDWAAEVAEIMLAKMEDRLPQKRSRPSERASDVELKAGPPREKVRLKVPSVELPDDLLRSPTKP